MQAGRATPRRVFSRSAVWSRVEEERVDCKPAELPPSRREALMKSAERSKPPEQSQRVIKFFRAAPIAVPAGQVNVELNASSCKPDELSPSRREREYLLSSQERSKPAKQSPLTKFFQATPSYAEVTASDRVDANLNYSSPSDAKPSGKQ